MTYVRDRVSPASKEYARKRREENRRTLAPDPANPGTKFDPALEWVRVAARYAGRRSYRRQGIADRAAARIEEIRAEAARVIQEAADQIAGPVPAGFRPSRKRGEIRMAYYKARTAKERLDMARAWQMHAYALAGRYARIDGGAAKARADEIRDRATVRLIEWAEEMDADDYGE